MSSLPLAASVSNNPQSLIPITKTSKESRKNIPLNLDSFNYKFTQGIEPFSPLLQLQSTLSVLRKHGGAWSNQALLHRSSHHELLQWRRRNFNIRQRSAKFRMKGERREGERMARIVLNGHASAFNVLESDPSRFFRVSGHVSAADWSRQTFLFFRERERERNARR